MATEEAIDKAASAGEWILLSGAEVLTIDQELGDFKTGDVLIQHGVITAVGADLKSALPQEPGLVLPLAGSIVMPGFVNAHVHGWIGHMRGIIPTADIAAYMSAIHGRLSPVYRPEDVYAGNLVTGLESLYAGITCIVDNSHIWRSPEHADAAVRATIESGVRSLYASGLPVFDPDRAGWLSDLARLKQDVESENQSLVTLGMMTMGQSMTAEAWSRAKQLGIWVVSEVGGGDDDERALSALSEAGLLDHQHTFNHCTDVTEKTWDLCASAGASVNICPRSDTQFQILGGTPGLAAALAHGFRPGLSTDNVASYGTDMLSEMRVMWHMYRASFASSPEDQTTRLSPQDFVEFATLRGAQNAGLGDVVGSLTPGKQGDILVVSRDTCTMWGVEDPYSALVSFAQPADITGVLVAGRVRKWAGELVPLTDGRTGDAIREHANESRARVSHDAGLSKSP